MDWKSLQLFQANVGREMGKIPDGAMAQWGNFARDL
jgi:hypothetical protein